MTGAAAAAAGLRVFVLSSSEESLSSESSEDEESFFAVAVVALATGSVSIFSSSLEESSLLLLFSVLLIPLTFTFPFILTAVAFLVDSSSLELSSEELLDSCFLVTVAAAGAAFVGTVFFSDSESLLLSSELLDSSFLVVLTVFVKLAGGGIAAVFLEADFLATFLSKKHFRFGHYIKYKHHCKNVTNLNSLIGLP